MLSPEQLVAFIVTALVITASPGPDNLMVLSVGISKGRRRGVAFGLGCALGCLSHTFLAALGVSAVIASSPTAFTALSVFGGLYLVWLGFNALRSTGSAPAHAAKAFEQTATRFFFKGVAANAINPKVALFFLSFLPPFVVASRGNVTGQIAALGVTFTVQAAILFSLLGYFSGAVGRWLNTKPRTGVILDRLAGIVFVALGLLLLASLTRLNLESAQ